MFSLNFALIITLLTLVVAIHSSSSVEAIALLRHQQQHRLSSAQTLTFYVHYPASQLQGAKLVVAGSPPLSWKSGPEFSPVAGKQNTWQTSIDVSSIWGKLTNTSVWNMDYKIVTETDQWELGRNHRVAIQKGANNQQVRVCPYFFTKAQQETVPSIYSPQLNNSRPVWVYIPGLILENTELNNCPGETEIVIAGDGQNMGSNSSTCFMGRCWRIDQVLQQMEDQLPPILVIAPYNAGGARTYEYTYIVDKPYGGGGAGKYAEFLEETVIPTFEKKFPTVNFSPKQTGCLGSSLGGLLCAWLGVTRSWRYSKLSCMSSSFWWANQNFLTAITPKLSQTNYKTQSYYMDSGGSSVDFSGNDDHMQTSRVATQFVLRTQGNFAVDDNLFVFLQRPDMHNEDFWHKRLPVYLDNLYGRDGLSNQ